MHNSHVRLSEAVVLAHRSPLLTHKTGALIVNPKGQLISTGWSHRSKLRLATTPQSIHAEMHAIIRAAQKYVQILPGSVCYVACISAAGNVTRARPCTSCQSVLKDAGIRMVTYTIPGYFDHRRYEVMDL